MIDTTFDQNPCTEHTTPTAVRSGRRAPLAWPYQRRRWESNPLEAALQAAAVPSGSSATFVSVLARNRTWSSTFAGSRAYPAHSEDRLWFSALPRNRTPSCSSVDCRAIQYTCRASISMSRPGVEPGSGHRRAPLVASEGPMRSVTPSRHSEPTTGFAPGFQPGADQFRSVPASQLPTQRKKPDVVVTPGFRYSRGIGTAECHMRNG